MEKKSTFDLVSDDSDHKYHNKNIAGNCFSDTKSAIYKRIMKEWKILEKNLPESIHVKAYERRIDLLRAVIVGAAGTPYHDGLFFFDIQFPENYPNNPPRIKYHSFGYRLNPNLYASGKVCLSLVNTWNGKKCEKWDPSNSTLLQVLVSIQALVLNENPFFNEPIYRSVSRSSYEKKSRAYNEDAFILTCYTVINLIRKPPKNFEDFVKEHFRERGSVLLTACREYANGRVRVGYYGCNEIASSSTTTVIKVKESLKVSLRYAYRIMFKQFTECGASLEGFLPDLEIAVQEKKKKKKKSSKRSNGGNGFFKKVMVKIKSALGLKKKKKKST